MPEPDVSKLIGVQEAIEIIDAAPVEPEVISLPLMQTSGLRLAEDVFADRDYPPFDKSVMDGYALRVADAMGAPCELPVTARIAAGEAILHPLAPCTAMAIMTGAPIPPGAQVVVPVEQTLSLDNGRRVRIDSFDPKNRFIAAAGSDIRKGAIVLMKGAKVGPAQIAVAASVGAEILKVFRASTVAVLSTGDEIVPFDRSPGPSQIRGSNSAMLISQLQKQGCTVRDLGNAPDDPAAIRSAIVTASNVDVIFITGGMSMGEKDYVPGILRELGAQFRITKLRIKPGKPFAFAQMPGGRYAFGLPGNPVSALVCTIRLASRLLARIAGGTPDDNMIAAKLTSPLPPNGPREFYQPAVLKNGSATPLPWKGSADIYTLANSNALIVRPENDSAKVQEDEVMIFQI